MHGDLNKEEFRMSRIAKDPIEIPSSVEVTISNGMIAAKGPKGTLDCAIYPRVNVAIDNGKINVSAKGTSKQARAMSGTTRSLIANMITGVTSGFERGLVLVGTGYRAKADNRHLNLNVGYSHPVEYEAPEGVVFEIKSESSTQVELVVKGIDKQVVGQVAANIRKVRPVEPYKGKGIRYAGERVRMKQAKGAVKA